MKETILKPKSQDDIQKELSNLEPYKLVILLTNKIADDNLQDIKILINCGFDINDYLITGWTPLMYACLGGCKNIAEFLLSINVDINKKVIHSNYVAPFMNCYIGDTALKISKKLKHKDIVELLKNKKAIRT